MARKKAGMAKATEEVVETSEIKEASPKKVIMDKVVADRYKANAFIRCVDKVYNPGDIVELSADDIKRMRKTNSIVLVED